MSDLTTGQATGQAAGTALGVGNAQNTFESGTSNAVPKGRSLWGDAVDRLKKDRGAIIYFVIIVVYCVIALMAKMEWIASPWNKQIAASYAPPSTSSIPMLFGTDIFGYSVFYKAIHGARVAISVGLVSCLISIPIGVVLGAAAGYFGGWVDDLVVWLYTTLNSIPYIMLMIAITLVLGKGLTAIYIALGVTSWIGLARVIRGEFMKHKTRDYVIAAESLGATNTSRIFKHIMPNVSHFVILNLSIQFVSAIKSEVILSYLGLGVQGQPSWGVMIDDAKLELSRGVWWQLAAATGAMFFVILAFNIFGDALRDALDPKIK
jgi:ABC-type dipeptide/oligopeptide/nickel transport system permease subunit